ncbi:substrate-binding domain-containing protein [Devosia sp. A8/3-2]|nr:substrate-binding domain-containing protein [Devosia sp. A8/3-2]
MTFKTIHFTRALLAGASLLAATGGSMAQSKIAIITPYLAQPGTQFYVESFQAAAEGKDWDVNVIDTAGDVAAVISRIEDMVTQNVDAIVINVDPSQSCRRAAGRCGRGHSGHRHGCRQRSAARHQCHLQWLCHGRRNRDLCGRPHRRGRQCGDVHLRGLPARPVRGVVADAVFGNFPDIKVLDRVTPDVSDGGIADSRAKMEAILAANPEPGSIKAVWAARDQPALGALQAIEAAGRDGEGIVITGIDANPQAREAIAVGGNFEASVARDFAGIGAATADAVTRVLAGEELKQRVTYVPTKLITAANAAE